MPESKKIRELKLRRQRLFPNAENRTFDNTRSGYAPLPLLFRYLLRAFRADHDVLRRGDFHVLAALYTCREGPLNLIDADADQLAHTVGLSTRHKLKGPIDRLAAMRFIEKKDDDGKLWILLLDPVLAVVPLFERGLIDENDLARINELLAAHDREPVALPNEMKTNAPASGDRAAVNHTATADASLPTG